MMKIILLIMATILPILFIGCEQITGAKIENKQQQYFNDFLTKKALSYYNQGNDIQKKDFYNKFEIELFNFIDSVRLFINWKGEINDIKTEESGESTILSFKISSQPEKYIKATLYSTHLVNTDSLKQDYIYNKVKNIPNSSTVYFDGFIRTNNKDEIDYYMDWENNIDLIIAYPNYRFWITDIGTTNRNDSLSVGLQAANDFNYKMIEPLKSAYMNKISKAESEKRFNELLPEFKMLKSKLTDEEKLYNERLNTCLVYNFLFGDK